VARSAHSVEFKNSGGRDHCQESLSPHTGFALHVIDCPQHLGRNSMTRSRLRNRLERQRLQDRQNDIKKRDGRKDCDIVIA
jgi:hypothetical protein